MLLPLAKHQRSSPQNVCMHFPLDYDAICVMYHHVYYNPYVLLSFLFVGSWTMNM
jgi:hypothetical protein